MKGKITNFNIKKGFGFIEGEDQENYFFHISNVLNPMEIEENYSVEFEPKKEKGSLIATNIKIIIPLSNKKDKILKIKDLRIKASDIKEYKISKYQKDGFYPDEDGKYHCKLVEEPNKYYKYIGFAKLNYDNDNETSVDEDELKNNFIQLTDRDLIDDLIGLHYNYDYNYAYKRVYLELLNKKSDLLNFKVCKRDCYMIEIKTYTSGEKYIEFRSHNGEINKEEAYKLLDYIDNELENIY